MTGTISPLLSEQKFRIKRIGYPPKGYEFTDENGELAGKVSFLPPHPWAQMHMALFTAPDNIQLIRIDLVKDSLLKSHFDLHDGIGKLLGQMRFRFGSKLELSVDDNVLITGDPYNPFAGRPTGYSFNDKIEEIASLSVVTVGKFRTDGYELNIKTVEMRKEILGMAMFSIYSIGLERLNYNSSVPP